MANIELTNWKRSITYRAHSLERVHSVEDIQAIVSDPGRYPSPVRVKGSHHSTTRCVVNDGGTVVDISGMGRILDIDRDALTIRMEAGVLLIDAAKALEREGLQFHVNIELGNLTVGSGACGGTKDASFVSDGVTGYGQVASYCIGMKTVQADGSILTVDEEQPELLAAMRSSYGMLGVIFEVTYRVKPIRPLVVTHVSYPVEEFAARLDELLDGDRSMMLYLFPFLDRVVVEFRSDGSGPIRPGGWQWRLRNWVWKNGSPGFGRLLSLLVPSPRIAGWILDRYHRLSLWVMTTVLHGTNTSPADQIIRYPEQAGFAAYTFSIWAIPRERYAEAIVDYYRFCREYFAEHGFRCNLLNVGYAIAADRQSLFSYTRHGSALTLDPVSTGGEGWDAFLDSYNSFCSAHGGTPLFNQTPAVTPAQAVGAFGAEIAVFLSIRRRFDPGGRFYSDFFRHLFQDGGNEEDVADQPA